MLETKRGVATCNRGFVIKARIDALQRFNLEPAFYPILTEVFILVVLYVHPAQGFKDGFSKPTKPRCFYFEIPHPLPSFQQ